MDINIDDRDLEGFSPAARERVTQAVTELATDVIEESNRLEASQNTSGHEREVTGSLVDAAALFVRKGFAQSRRPKSVYAWRIGSAISTLLTGAFFDFNRFGDPGFAIFYITLVAVTVLLVTLAVLKD